jgi:hypothetical protein
MPLFNWLVAFQMGWGFGAMVKDELDRFEEDVEGEHFGVTVTKTDIELANLLAHRGERERSEEAKLERTRWLEEHHAERTFMCGVVPDPVLEATQPEAPEVPPAGELLPSDPGWALPGTVARETAVPPDPQPLTPLRPMQVLAAVLPTDLVFIREYGDGEEVEEVGRLPRRAIEATDVVDSAGAHVPEPVEEAIEPSMLAWTVLRWSNEGTPDEDRFTFRSRWTAWEAARRLLEAKQG